MVDQHLDNCAFPSASLSNERNDLGVPGTDLFCEAIRHDGLVATIVLENRHIVLLVYANPCCVTILEMKLLLSFWIGVWVQDRSISLQHLQRIMRKHCLWIIDLGNLLTEKSSHEVDHLVPSFQPCEALVYPNKTRNSRSRN
jgi:hypothetical protein